MTPQTALQDTTHETSLSDLPGDRVAGYGVMGIPFASGDYLALRDWTASSFGPAYRSIWHRDADGDWTVYSDQPPKTSCARFLRPEVSATRTTEIELDWPDDCTLVVEIPAAALRWKVTLERTAITRMLSKVAPAMPTPVWRSDAALRLIGTSSATMLRTGRLRLTGTMPNGQHFQLAPQHMWRVRDSTAHIGPRDFGEPRPAQPQVSIGEVPLPQRGIFYTATTARFYDTSRAVNTTGAKP
ncbi:MAG: hypothetical protein L0K86_10515 [Actinomycetia bacterium]|nr:hypothetical protein [Actinomycetes bacterium]